MRRLKILATEGAQALEIGEAPTNNAVDHDQTVIDSSESDPMSNKLTDEQRESVERVKALDAAQDKIERLAEEDISEDLWSPVVKKILPSEPQFPVETADPEERLQREVQTAQGLVEIEHVSTSLGHATGLIQALEDLEAVASHIDKPTPTEAALLQIAGNAVVAGADADPRQITPAMEDNSDTSDRKGVIRRIVDKVMEMLRKFYEWVKKFVKNMVYGGRLQDQNVERLKTSLKEVKQETAKAPAKPATSIPPIEMPYLMVAADKAVSDTSGVMQAMVVFTQQFDAMGSGIIAEIERLRALAKKSGGDDNIEVELVKPLGLKPGDTELSLPCWPGRLSYVVQVSSQPNVVQSRLDHKTAADVLNSITYALDMAEPEGTVEMLVPDIKTVERIAEAYFKQRESIRQMEAKLGERIDLLQDVTKSIEQQLQSAKNRGDLAKALFCAEFSRVAATLCTVAVRALTQCRGNYHAWMQKYIDYCLNAYKSGQ